MAAGKEMAGKMPKRPRPAKGSDPEWESRQQKKRELRRAAAQLPVSEAEEAICDLVRQNQAIVLIGETGSGKTTQVPQFLYKALFSPPREVDGEEGAGAAKGPPARGGVVGITQPRRIAAVTVAHRVAEEFGCAVGGRVGYAVRFDDTTGPNTKIKYMTDGLLLRELLTSETLENYSCIILDEAHERSINSDVLMGLLKELVSTKRPDLKVVVMSATLQADMFSRFWNNCPVGYVEGRAYPVDIFYTNEPVQSIIDAAVTTALQIHIDNPEDAGDILVFLTGQDTIEDAARMLEEKSQLLGKDEMGLIIVPLYASLSSERQVRAFVPPPKGRRKVILATNVAETSLTIPNIRFVVDSGMAKEKRYNARTGMDSLVEAQISQAQARQRAGRAGRVQAGRCFRMYTEQAYLDLDAATEPEIKRMNLSAVILQLKQLGINDPLSFDFVDPPSRTHLVAALHILLLLGALDNRGQITKLGSQIGAFPITPTHGRALLQAEANGVFDEVASIIAMLTVENVLASPSAEERAAADKKRLAFASPHGDHISLLNLYTDYRKQRTSKERSEWCRALFINQRKVSQVADVKKQLSDVFAALRKAEGSVIKPPTPENDDDSDSDSAAAVPGADDVATTNLRSVLKQDKTSAIRKAFCAGFFLNVAQYNADKKAYVTAEGRHDVAIHPNSVLFRQRHKPPLLLFNELVYTKKRYMRDVLAIDEAWLVEAAPGRWTRK